MKSKDCQISRLVYLFFFSRVHVSSVGLDILQVVRTSQSQGWQRAGRAGRQSEGSCYRILTKNVRNIKIAWNDEKNWKIIWPFFRNLSAYRRIPYLKSNVAVSQVSFYRLSNYPLNCVSSLKCLFLSAILYLVILFEGRFFAPPSHEFIAAVEEISEKPSYQHTLDMEFFVNLDDIHWDPQRINFWLSWATGSWCYSKRHSPINTP